MDLLLRIIGLASGRPADRLVELIGQSGVVDPALKAEWEAAVRGAVSVDNLETLKAWLPAEIENIKQLKLDPRDRPSDF
jgi:hypothetical protein